MGWNKYMDVGSIDFSFTFVVCVRAYEIRVIYLFPPFLGSWIQAQVARFWQVVLPTEPSLRPLKS